MRLTATLFCAFFVLISAPTYSADVFEQLIDRKTGRTFNAIVLRDMSGKFIIASPKGPKELAKLEVRRNSTSQGVTHRLNELFGSIETWIRRSRFEQAKTELSRLEDAIKQFEGEVDLKLQSSVTTPDDAKSLKVARTYYRTQQASVEPTIETLGLSRSLASQLKAVGDRTLKTTEFIALAKELTTLKEITKTIDLAKNERRDAIKGTSDKLSAAATAFVKDAIDDAADKWNVTTAVSMMGVFEEAAKIDPAYESAQVTIANALTKQSAAVANGLTKSVYAGFSFVKTPEMTRRFLDEVEKELRTSSRALTYLQRRTYGKRKSETNAMLKARVDANDKALAAAKELYAKVKKVTVLYRDGVAFDSRGLHAKAIERMIEVKKAAAAAGVLSSRLRNDVETKTILYEGDSLLEELRSPSDATVASVRQLIGKSEAFTKKHRIDKRLKLPFAEFDRKAGELEKFITLVPKLDRLKSTSSLPAHDMVSEAIQLQRLLANRDSGIHPVAEKILKNVWNSERAGVLNRAGKTFMEGAWTIDSAKREEVFLNVMNHSASLRDHETLEALIGTVYEQLKGRSTDFISKVVDMDAKTAFSFSQTDLPRAMSIFDRIKKHQPAMFERLDLGTRFQEMLLLQARELTKSEQLEDAVKVYEKICQTAPHFAAINGVFKLLFDLKVKLDGTIVTDREKRRGLLEEYCKTYGEKMGQVPLVQTEKDEIMGELTALWVDKNTPLASATAFLKQLESHPSVLKESGVTGDYLLMVKDQVSKLRNRVERSRLKRDDGRAAIVPVPTPVLTALKMLNTPNLKYLFEKNNLHVLYATLAKAKAETYLERDSIQKATALLKEVQSEYPDIATDLKIGDIVTEYESELWLERLREPLRIRSKKERAIGNLPAMYVDFGALLFWVLFWGIYLLNAFSTGKTRERMGYHMKHFAVVFVLFALLMAFFLWFGKLPHLHAVACALVFPMIVLNLLSMISYGFFPLIYEGRKLAFKKFFLRLPVVGPKMTGLAETVKVQERDLPLLAQPLAFKILKASQLEDRKVAADKLQTFLDKIESCKNGKLDAHRSDVLMHLGIALADLERTEDAEAILERYVALDDHQAEAHWRLGVIKYDKERYESAIEDFKHCLAERGGDDALMARLGRCYFEMGKFKSALKCFDVVVDPDRDSRFYKARALARIGQLEDSVTCYQELLKDDPNDPRTLYSLASSFAVLGKDVKALKVIGLIQEGNPYHPHAIGLQGSIFLRNGKIDKAKDHFTRALKEEENLVPVLHGLGQLLLEEGALDEAQEMFEKVLEVDPFNGAAAFHLAVALEKKGEVPDFELFEKAMEDPQIYPLASVLAARAKFYNEDYEAAITLFQGGKSKKPLSGNDLYMLCRSQLEVGKIDEAHATMGEIGTLLVDADASGSFLLSGVYDIAQRLMNASKYKDAIKAFALVKQHAGGNKAIRAHIDKLLTEASMRSIFELLNENGLVKAVKLIKTLTMLPESMGYTKRATYYSGILDLRRKDFSGANKTLEALFKTYPDDKRIQYHLAVAKVGIGDMAKAKALMDDLSKGEVTDFLKVGLAETRAFILAAEGKLTEAEQAMAELPSFGDSSMGKFLDKRVRIVRADFLCRIHDSVRLQFLLADMDDEEKAQVAYLQAVSALEGGEIGSVVRNLKPFASKTIENTKLFAILCAKLAKQMMDDGNPERAIATLEQIPHPPLCVMSVLNHLKINETVAAIETPDEIRTAILTLEKMYEETSDIDLQSMILHNLFLLKFKLPMSMEDCGQWEGSEKAWTTFRAFMKAMTENLDYWNSRVERMDKGSSAQRFVSREVEHFMEDFNASVLLPAHIGRALASLQQDNPEYLNRHIVAVVKLGREAEKLKEFVQRLGITAKHYSDSLAKDDPLQKTWGFVIGYLMIQISVREALNSKEKSPLRPQLESYLAVRQHFASPSEFLKAKKVFNTTLLDALQNGIEGKFSKSGDALEKCLTKIPPGINLDAQLESALWTLREQARKPSAIDEGINIAQEFEKTYQRVLNYSIQRGA